MTPTPPDRRGPPPSGRRDPSPGYLDATEQWYVSPRSRPEEQDPRYGPPPPREPDYRDPPGYESAPPAQEARRGRGEVRGVARRIGLRTNSEGVEVLAFRVDRYDPAGNRLQPVGVEMVAYQGGQISDGEEVIVSGHWHHGTLRSDRVINVTTGAQAKGLSHSVVQFATAVKVILFFAIIAFIAFVAVQVFSHM